MRIPKAGRYARKRAWCFKNDAWAVETNPKPWGGHTPWPNRPPWWVRAASLETLDGTGGRKKVGAAVLEVQIQYGRVTYPPRRREAA